MSRKHRMLASHGCASLAFLVFCARLLPAIAQTIVHPPVKTNGSGGNTYDGPQFIRYAETRDTQDKRIDLFMGDWRESMPRHEHGSLVLRDVLTRGDNFSPPQRGAVLQSANLPMVAFSQTIARRSLNLRENRRFTTSSTATATSRRGEEQFRCIKTSLSLCPRGSSFR
jgi:hypothetical protein